MCVCLYIYIYIYIYIYSTFNNVTKPKYECAVLSHIGNTLWYTIIGIWQYLMKTYVYTLPYIKRSENYIIS